MRGYSDRIHHALAYAAKHHDQQVRKGTRLPYFTQPANVAVILARYDRDETTTVAGVLHDVVEDCVRDGLSREALHERIASKFGTEVVEIVLQVTERRADDDGVELAPAERRDDLLARLAAASEPARWVLAAEAIHNAGSLLADLRRTAFPETVWARVPSGREGTPRWYRRVHERLREVGFDAPIMDELGEMSAALERAASEAAAEG